MRHSRRRRTVTQLVLSWIVTAVSKAMADRTLPAYDPICDVCNGDLAGGFHWVHRMGGPLMAACLPCADEARAAGFTVDPIRRVSVRPA